MDTGRDIPASIDGKIDVLACQLRRIRASLERTDNRLTGPKPGEVNKKLAAEAGSISLDAQLSEMLSDAHQIEALTNSLESTLRSADTKACTPSAGAAYQERAARC